MGKRRLRCALSSVAVRCLARNDCCEACSIFSSFTILAEGGHWAELAGANRYVVQRSAAACRVLMIAKCKFSSFSNWAEGGQSEAPLRFYA